MNKAKVVMWMRSLGQFQTFWFFLRKNLRRTKKHKTHISKQKQKRLRFYVFKKYLREKESLIRLFVFLYFLCFLCFCLVASLWFLWFLYILCFLCFLCFLWFFVRVSLFCKKKKRIWNCPNDLIYITTEFILLLT